MPARGDKTAERGGMRGQLAGMHRPRIEFGLRIGFGGNDVRAGAHAWAAVGDLAWVDIIPMKARHGDPLRKSLRYRGTHIDSFNSLTG